MHAKPATPTVYVEPERPTAEGRAPLSLPLDEQVRARRFMVAWSSEYEDRAPRLTLHGISTYFLSVPRRFVPLLNNGASLWYESPGMEGTRSFATPLRET